MDARLLTTCQEWLEADRLIETAFLHPWDEGAAAEKVRAQAAGTTPRPERTWGLCDDDGSLLAAVTTLDRQFYAKGELLDMGEVAMVGSRVESRGGGNVRTLMAAILADFKGRGFPFAALIPFSCVFYRKFGFELASHALRQRVPIEQLAGLPCELRATHVEREEDVVAVRGLYDAFARVRNLAPVRDDAAWRWRGNGEFGERGFGLDDCRHDTYVLWGEDGVPRASVTFAFKHEAGRPFFGELEVTDLAYDGPEAFLAMLGMLYRLRAKAGHVTLELCDDIDLATILPDGDKVERTSVDFAMLRVLDVCRALELMEAPVEGGSFAIRVEDSFLPENSGIYQVRIVGGQVQAQRSDVPFDLCVSVQTLCLLAIGRIGLAEALLREGTQLLGNKELLAKVFAKRPVHFAL